MRISKISFYILPLFTIASAVLSALNMLVFTGFHRVPVALGIAAVLLGVAKGCRSGGTAKRLIFCALLITAILLVDFAAVLLNPRERQMEYTSPGGTTTIVMEYDLVSRPLLYRKHNSIFMTRIPFTIGTGYNETVSHNVVWLSEMKIQLEDDYGEAWMIEL